MGDSKISNFEIVKLFFNFRLLYMEDMFCLQFLNVTLINFLINCINLNYQSIKWMNFSNLVGIIYYIWVSFLSLKIGDVFQYHLHLNHTFASQTPAHHVIIRYYLPLMLVYQDFIPSNNSRIPRTKILEGLGPIQADSLLQLYLYKLDMDEFIWGTFLIQVSTKLGEGRFYLLKILL